MEVILNRPLSIIKNHKKKIFKCFFIILSGLFKMTSIYGNEPLNEAI